MNPEAAKKSLTVSSLRNTSFRPILASGVLTRMTKHSKSKIRAENIIRTIEVAKSCCGVPKTPATKACLMRETFSERVTMVALSKKALVSVSLKATASASALEGSN